MVTLLRTFPTAESWRIRSRLDLCAGLGKQGPNKGDRLKIALVDGVFDGYTVDAEIERGQITLHMSD